MNILVVTPLYKIDNRPELFQDTCAIHYLVKNWTTEHNVRVINVYTQPFNKIVRYSDAKQRAYGRNGYEYICDGVPVSMCEVTLKPKQSWILDIYQSKKVAKYIEQVIEKYNFHSDVCLVHLPVVTVNVWKHIDLKCNKIGVLHETDVNNTARDSELLKKLSKEFTGFLARSKKLKTILMKTQI